MSTGQSIAIESEQRPLAHGAGLLIVGHGSREQAGVDEFLQLARMVAAATRPAIVEPCFLEFARPTIDEGFRALVARGARRVVVAPVLLFSAGHARQDIPAAVAAVAGEYSHVAVTQSDHLGCHDLVLALSKRRHDEAIEGQPHVADDETALVLVGRGSHEPTATAEMTRFVALRREMTRVAHATACFVSMAEPRLENVLDQMARCGAKRVVVQPHLLFGGVLADRIAATVARHADRHPHVQWLTTGCLGPSPMMAHALVDRAAATLERVN